MKIIITEEQFSRFNKSSPALQNGINRYLNLYIQDGYRKVGKKSHNYGNLREDWCVNGKQVISAIYYFDNDKFERGWLLVSKELVEIISNLFSVKPSYVFHVIEEWYEDTMIPKFEQTVGETGLYINLIDTFDGTEYCTPEAIKPENITDDEMIEFIVKNTLYTKPEVMDLIDSGERELEDFYLEIVNIVDRKKKDRFLI